MPLAALQGVVSGEFATGNGLTSLTAPIILNYRPAGATLTSIGEVVLWGYVCDPMSLRRPSTLAQGRESFDFAQDREPVERHIERPSKALSRNGCDSEETPPARRTNDVVAFGT